MSANVAKKEATELVKLSDINSALGTKLKNFFGVQWIDATTLFISETGKFYSYNINSKSGKLLQEIPETAENQTFDEAKINIAFTASDKNDTFDFSLTIFKGGNTNINVNSNYRTSIKYDGQTRAPKPDKK